MELIEINKPPEFTLKMSLQDTVELYKLVCESYENGNKDAEKFIDVLNDFAANSNHYTEWITW